MRQCETGIYAGELREENEENVSAVSTTGSTRFFGRPKADAEFKGGILKKGSEEPRLEKGMSYSTGGCKHWHLRTQSPAASAAGTRRAEREMGFLDISRERKRTKRHWPI